MSGVTSRRIDVVAPFVGAYQSVDLAPHTAIEIFPVSFARDADAAATLAMPVHLKNLACVDVVAEDKRAVAKRAVHAQLANGA